MRDMTIAEIRAAKVNAEEEIKAAISKFIDATGIEVEGVEVRVTNAYAIASAIPTVINVQARLNVKLFE